MGRIKNFILITQNRKSNEKRSECVQAEMIKVKGDCFVCTRSANR